MNNLTVGYTYRTDAFGFPIPFDLLESKSFQELTVMTGDGYHRLCRGEFNA